MTRDEFADLLSNTLNASQSDASMLYDKVDTAGNGCITFGKNWLHLNVIDSCLYIHVVFCTCYVKRSAASLLFLRFYFIYTTDGDDMKVIVLIKTLNIETVDSAVVMPPEQ